MHKTVICSYFALLLTGCTLRVPAISIPEYSHDKPDRLQKNQLQQEMLVTGGVELGLLTYDVSKKKRSFKDPDYGRVMTYDHECLSWIFNLGSTYSIGNRVLRLEAGGQIAYFTIRDSSDNLINIHDERLCNNHLTGWYANPWDRVYVSILRPLLMFEPSLALRFTPRPGFPVSISAGAGYPQAHMIWNKHYYQQVMATPYAFERVPVESAEGLGSGISIQTFLDGRMADQLWLGGGFIARYLNTDLAGEHMQLQSYSFFLRFEGNSTF